VNSSDAFETVTLTTRSLTQAMDWSLVLASQGIAHRIASPDESGQWALQLAPDDLERAQVSVARYEAENAPRPWQQTLVERRLLFDWVALIWVALQVGIHALVANRPTIEAAGIMHGTAVSNGEWWRLFTATQLHKDSGHLLSNVSIGFVLLALVMGRWGSATGWLAAVVAGVGGNLLNWMLQPDRFSLGASGVVMGCLGLLALQPRQMFPLRAPMWRGVLAGVSGAVLLFVLLGLDPRADLLAHAGGFATGLMLAALLRAWPRLHNTRSEIAAAGLLTLAWLLPWWAAIQHARLDQ
jgi:membrane associated rhomboid family serine protease